MLTRRTFIADKFSTEMTMKFLIIFFIFFSIQVMGENGLEETTHDMSSILESVNTFTNSPSHNYCQAANVGSPIGGQWQNLHCSPPLSWNQERVCNNPAKYICNKNINPAVDTLHRTYNNLKTSLANAERDLSSSGVCSPSCRSAAERRVAQGQGGTEGAYSERRTNSAKQIFNRALGRITTMLRNKFPAEASTLIQLLPARDSLHFANQNRKMGQLEWNAHSSLTEGVTLGSMVMLVDNSNGEKILEQILTHEIAHMIDPCNFEKLKKIRPNIYATYPLAGVAQCLSRSDGLGAYMKVDPNDGNMQGHYIGTARRQIENRPGNIFSPDSEDKKKEHIKTWLQDFNETTRATPSCMGISNAYAGANSEREFKQPQGGEAMADWLATESLADGLSLPTADDPQSVLSNFAPYISLMCQYYDQEKQCDLGAHQELVMGRKNKDEHNLAVDRINRIFFANPKFNRALGCASRTQEINANSAPVGARGQGRTVYCPSSVR
mgnify:CR=1 FL=1